MSRRERGPSPKGDFEQSKQVALDAIERDRLAEKLKTERLKAARLASVKQTQSRQIGNGKPS